MKKNHFNEIHKIISRNSKKINKKKPCVNGTATLSAPLGAVSAGGGGGALLKVPTRVHCTAAATENGGCPHYQADGNTAC